jgi:hypothetical protein
MFSGTKNKWLVLVAIAAIAAFVLACGTDETKLLSDNSGNGGVGSQPTDDTASTSDPVDSPPATLPEDPGYDQIHEFAPIESVQILTLESYPEQFVVQVISGLPSGCATFSHAEVTQDGTDINIDVYNMVPAPGELIACTMMYGIHDENVGLGSDFERGTEFTVIVNGTEQGSFTTGSSPIQVDPPYSDPGFEIQPAPVEDLEIISDQDADGATAYYASVSIGLSDGCKEIIEPNVVTVDRETFEIYPVVKVPTGDVMCIAVYLIESARVLLGTVGEDLAACAVYVVNAGDKTATFQAIAPNVRCVDPDQATPTPQPPTGGTSLISDSLALELSLRGKGADVENGGQGDGAKQFGVVPTELKVNGQQVLIYEFGPGSAAQEASETVNSNGSELTTAEGVMMVHWIATPHFYLYGNAIILYVGDDADIVDLLNSTASLFAGPGVDGTDDADEDVVGEFTTKLATIESVQIASTRSIPAQHTIAITIALGGSCETFNSIDWFVEGREVNVSLLTQVPTAPVPCTLAIIYEDQSINIGSEFEAGVEYDVIVNGERQGTFFGG